MKKFILFLIMLVFLSTNLYAEELHYHKDIWCLNPDGTYMDDLYVEKNKDGSINISGEGYGCTDSYEKKSLQEEFNLLAEYAGIPTQIPSKKTDYDSEKIAGVVTVEPVSSTQIFYSTYQDGGSTVLLMTYNPATKTTRITNCYEYP